MWKVCIARGRNPPRTFDAFYIFTIKFSKSPPRNFQTFQSGGGGGDSGPEWALYMNVVLIFGYYFSISIALNKNICILPLWK